VDRNGDEFGACAEVEGYIDGADWCRRFTKSCLNRKFPKGCQRRSWQRPRFQRVPDGEFTDG